MTVVEDAPFQRLVCEEFALSWAGAFATEDGDGIVYCLGSEVGQLLFLDAAGRAPGRPLAVSPSGEAVNGVATDGRFFAVTTRADVSTVGDFPTGKRCVESIPHGAYGVVGHEFGFLAPAGPGGLVAVRTVGLDRPQFGTIGPDDSTPTPLIYQTVAVPHSGGSYLVAAAARGHGLASVVIDPNAFGGDIRTVTHPGADVVDVCRIGMPTRPRAVAAVTLDGTLMLAGDLLAPHTLVTLRLPTLRGRVYGMRRGGTALAVLTADGLHLYPFSVPAIDPIQAWRPLIGRPTFVPLEAFDLNVGPDGRLIVAMADDSVRVYDPADITRRAVAATTTTAPPEAEFFEPTWQEADFRHTSRELQPA